MSFYNQKEDVIDIELTSYGKRLLSEGKLSPTFYSFFDDDIIYDIASGGATEKQNDSHPRITGSLRIRNQVNYSGIETTIKQVLREVRTSNPALKETDFVAIQNSEEREYALGDPLGTSSPSTTYGPGWQATALKGNFNAISTYLTGTQVPGNADTWVSRQIPQLVVNINCALETVDNIDDWGFESSRDVEIVQVFSDNSALVFKREELILDLYEINGVFSRENFDIEVFELPGAVDFVGDAANATVCHYTGSQLSFVNANLKPTQIPDVGPTYVEYYLDILVDNEIDQNLMCDLKPPDPSKGLFDQRAAECDDLPLGDAKNEDVYGFPLNSEDGIGPCED